MRNIVRMPPTLSPLLGTAQQAALVKNPTSGRITSRVPFNVKRDSSIEMANAIREIIIASVFAGFNAFNTVYRDQQMNRD
jgi:hypothetical protein